MFPLSSTTRSGDVILRGNYVMITKWIASAILDFPKTSGSATGEGKVIETTKRTFIYH